MPNIIINTYCNLSCPYCFATTLKNTEKKQDITIEQLNHILNWLKPTMTNKTRIGIIGGEPTLHPQFEEILNIITNFSNKYKNQYILFTNGIKLYKYIEHLSEKTILLVNYNSPSILTKLQQEELKQSLELLSFYNYDFALGCNICNQINDYDFFWKAVLIYGIKYVRVSIAAPIALVNKDDYYLNLKSKFIEFIELSKKYKVILELDCSQIPLKYFTIQEKNVVLPYLQNTHSCMTNIPIDITPDFKATGCFGCYNLIDLNNYNTLLDAKKELISYRKQYMLEHKNDIIISGCIPK